MFVDASALVAILTEEPEGEMMAAIVEQAAGPITSAVAVFEAALAIRRKRRRTVRQAYEYLNDFLEVAQVRIVPITAAQADIAVDSLMRYGKGEGRPAGLNMGDCFAYASARVAGCALLFKGNDFSQTDIEAAISPH